VITGLRLLSYRAIEAAPRTGANPMDVEENRYRVPDVFGTIIREMQSDDDGYRQNAKFQWWFDECNDTTKAIIDQTLAMICGWSMATLISKSPINDADDVDD
jgi:hypothetical protein